MTKLLTRQHGFCEAPCSDDPSKTWECAPVCADATTFHAKNGGLASRRHLCLWHKKADGRCARLDLYPCLPIGADVTSTLIGDDHIVAFQWHWYEDGVAKCSSVFKACSGHYFDYIGIVFFIRTSMPPQDGFRVETQERPL